jgi:putative endonuclease
MLMREYYVYIMTNASRSLYVGVTNDLIRRLAEHKTGIGSQFTQKYRIHQLVYYESTDSVTTAIEREKQIKGWSRAKKVKLIEQTNPEWKDLAAEW